MLIVMFCFVIQTFMFWFSTATGVNNQSDHFCPDDHLWHSSHNGSVHGWLFFPKIGYFNRADL